MRKKQILKRMLKIINKDKKKEDKLNKQQLEEVIEAFKQVILECVQNGEDFDYRGFLEVETNIVEPRERTNPKTQETFIAHRGYKANVRFTYSIKQFIKSLVAK